MATFKKLGKAILCRKLEAQIRYLRSNNDFKIVAVVGSVGKTSTKLAIAKTLADTRRVQFQNGNYNDRLTVPLIFFGEQQPAIYNVTAWFKLLRRCQRQTHQPYPYDIVVLELGVDGPNQMQVFKYLRPDLLVVSAVAPEHMEYFGTLDKVAQEELAPMAFSKQSLLGIDDIPAEFLPPRTYSGYGSSDHAQYQLVRSTTEGLNGQTLSIKLPDATLIDARVVIVGQQGAKIALAAAATAHMLGLPADQLATSLQAITPTAGRMQILPGIQNSTLIDDTYNASPLTVKAALDVLYAAEAPQRIAILGSMNEMGTASAAMHQEVGVYCDPGKLDEVITIGHDAATYLAPNAEKIGCSVKTFTSPYEAGAYVKSKLKDGAVVLAKGSQNGVFAEEALKQLLANPDDSAKLVRQSPYWLKQKRAQFK